MQWSAAFTLRANMSSSLVFEHLLTAVKIRAMVYGNQDGLSVVFPLRTQQSLHSLDDQSQVHSHRQHKLHTWMATNRQRWSWCLNVCSGKFSHTNVWKIAGEGRAKS